ncbi:hypothetical protein [Streptomyces sp. NPDC093707]
MARLMWVFAIIGLIAMRRAISERCQKAAAERGYAYSLDDGKKS